MKPVHRTWHPAALAAILFTATLCLDACGRSPESMKRPNMTALSPRLQPLFEKTRTVCFGRFIVEVPDTATVVYGPAAVDSPIEYYPGEADKLAQHVTEQLVEVEKDRKFLDKDDFAKFSMFGKVTDGVLPGQKLVFGSRDHASYSIHSYIPVGKNLYVQHIDSAVSKNEDIASLNTGARNLRLRAENEIPSEPGICIDGGFVSWQPEFEKVTLGVRLKEFPDVHFSIEVLKNQEFVIESSALEPRLKDAEKIGGSWYSRIKVFRRGPRQLGNWAGFEVLAHLPAQEKSTESHEFHYHSLGAPNDPLQPELDIQLDTGVENDRTAGSRPSLTDEEAVALWDKLTTSIRVRPTGGDAKHSATEPPKAPLDKFVATGGVCPQTGWWQCSEGGAVAGGRRRHFAAGETLPHAVLLGEPSVWQKFTGERPTYKTATVWQLVDDDAVPTVPAPIAKGPTPPQTDVISCNPIHPPA